jgi:hypothetical protein
MIADRRTCPNQVRSHAAWSAFGGGAGQDHPSGAGIIESNGHLIVASFSCHCHPASGHPLRDLPAHRGLPARRTQRGADRALPPGPPRSARPSRPVRSAARRITRWYRRRRQLRRTRSARGHGVWPPSVKARARTRRYGRRSGRRSGRSLSRRTGRSVRGRPLTLVSGRVTKVCCGWATIGVIRIAGWCRLACGRVRLPRRPAVPARAEMAPCLQPRE